MSVELTHRVRGLITRTYHRLTMRHHVHVSHLPSVDFLHVLQRYTRERRKRYWKWGGVALMACVIVIVIIGAAGVRRAWIVAEKASQAKSHLLYSVDVLRDQDFTTALENMRSADVLLQDARRDLSPWMSMRIIPYLGVHLRAADTVLTAAIHLNTALQRGTIFGEELVTSMSGGQRPLRVGDITDEQKRVLLRKLSAAPPVLRAIETEVNSALMLIESIPNRRFIGPLQDVIDPLREQLPRLKRSLALAIPFVEAAPLASGFPDARTYLLLFQNSDELRPTGGFIGTYGLLRVRNGGLEDFYTDNIYRIDRLAERHGLAIEPPLPLQQYLHVKKWFLRDANWSPDFQDAAQQIILMYGKEVPSAPHIDGVIAITPTIVERLLRLLGPITIDETTFTAENLVDTLQYHVEQRYVELGLPEIERKEVVGRMAAALLDRALHVEVRRIPDVLDIVKSVLDEKHILLYAADPTMSSIIAKEEWGGDMKNAAQDYAMVVDANMAALKTDSVMQRSIVYAVVPTSDHRLKATMRVRYENTGQFSWKTTRYRTYTRVYIPKGSTLLSATGFMDGEKPWGPKEAVIGDEFNKVVVSGFMNVEPNTSHTLTLEYLLPETIGQNGYALYWQKQPGTIATQLTVSLAFGTTVDTWSPTGLGVKVRGKQVEFASDLRFDREFSVQF